MPKSANMWQAMFGLGEGTGEKLEIRNLGVKSPFAVLMANPKCGKLGPPGWPLLEKHETLDL